MKITVTFDDTGIEEEHDFDFEPRAGGLITLVRDGESVDYVVVTVSGPILGNHCQPSIVRVKRG